MTKKDLQEIFESSFNWDNWRKVMDFVFPEFQFSAQKIPIEDFTKAAEERIEGFYHHGSTSLTDHISLNLYEVELKESVYLPRNVKGIRKFIASEAIANTQASVAVFYSPDKSKWRFTLATKQLDKNFKESDRKPESYTYVFGEGERGRTAAERFFDLSKKTDKKLKDLEEAFSVEALSKKFFTQYKEVYLQFVNNIIDNPSRLSLFKGDDREKLARDFVKKMMGRIVFLYFLQKKGWMGCKSKWQKGEDLFMKKLFEAAPKDGSFYMTYLEPLFFDTLNAKREEIEEDCIINEVNFGKVPFLNGGLFEREDNHPNNLTLDWEIFNRFFEILNNYNFTIIEDDPDFKEIAVDPEMLGHIFENLLEDNKDKGAFYTPKEIVQYMCQESLIEYLNTQLSKKIENEALKIAIRDFVIKQDFVALNDINQRADQYLLQALRDIKVCDPAIGSGAFPMGILHEIYRMVEYLQEGRDIFLDIWEKETWDAARVKEDIIQNSIYGVDIEKGAVDIARLRFWLSIIIDEEEPKPLPNLDYKIVVGNSLLNKFEDHVIDVEWKEGEKTVETERYLGKRSQLLKAISEKQIAYFDAESSKRYGLSKEIKDLKIDILINELEIKVVSEGLLHEPQPHLKKSKFLAAQKQYFLTLEWLSTIKELKSIKGTDKPFDHFDWNLDFPEILNPIINNVNKGFDLVIGNPPYVEHKKLKSIAYLLKSRYDVYTGSSDLSVYFFEKGFELLKEGSGVLTYINTNKFFSTGYGKELRKYLLSKNIKSLINFEQVEIFEGILVSSTIISAQNCISNPESEFLYLGYEKNNNWIDGFEKDLKARNCFPLSILDDSEWSFQTGVGVEIKRKVEDNGTPLKLINGLDIKRGVTTGYDPAFIIDNSLSEQFEPDIIKPLLKGRSIKKYLNLPSNLMLIFTRTGIDISLYAKTESYLQEFKEDLQPRTSKGERGRKPGSYKWFEIQDNTAYYKLFDQVKIIWPLTADKWGFTIDKDGHYLTSGGFLLVSEVVSLTYILAFLNSSLMRYYFGFVGVMTAGGAYTLKKATIENFPIIIPENDSVLEPIVNEILSLKRDTIDTTELEQKIDQFFFKLYELNFEEVIEIIPNFWLTEEEYTNFSLEDLEV